MKVAVLFLGAIASFTRASPVQNNGVEVVMQSRGDTSNEIVSLINDGIKLAGGHKVDISLAHALEKNKTLVDVTWNHINGHVSPSFVCHECWSQGSATAELTSGPALRLTLRNVAAYVSYSAAFTGQKKFSNTLWSSNTPLGIKDKSGTTGVVVSMDLYITTDTSANVTSGFWVKMPPETSIEVGLLDGKLVQTSFDGTTSGSLPIVVQAVNNDAITMRAMLRMRLFAGVERKGSIFGHKLDAAALLHLFYYPIELTTTWQQNTPVIGTGLTHTIGSRDSDDTPIAESEIDNDDDGDGVEPGSREADEVDTTAIASRREEGDLLARDYSAGGGKACKHRVLEYLNMAVGAQVSTIIDFGPGLLGATPATTFTLMAGPTLTECADGLGVMQSPTVTMASIGGAAGAKAGRGAAPQSPPVVTAAPAAATTAPASTAQARGQATSGCESDDTAPPTVAAAPTPTAHVVVRRQKSRRA